MKKSETKALHRFIPIYLPYFLLSIGSALLVYLAIATLSRRVITCNEIRDMFGCDYTLFKMKVGEGIAQAMCYAWFILAQVAFYKLYSHRNVYTLKHRFNFSGIPRVIASFYCLAVTASGFGSILMLTWRIAAASH